MRILLMRTWLRNIGNGFIDKGARAALKRAFPEAEVIETSGFPFLSASLKEQGGDFNPLYQATGSVGEWIKSKQLEKRTFRKNIFDISDTIPDIDLAVLPGCVLYEFALRPYEYMINRLQEKNIPLILLGVGGGDYKSKTRRYVSEWLQSVDPAGMITRDKEAYKHYSDIVEKSYNGIDCGFFVNEWYTPPDSRDPFTAATFDKIPEPDLNTQLTVRPSHTPFGDSKPYAGTIEALAGKYRGNDFFSKKNAFVSDSLKDYLYIYKNATETHSDRIHACVPALAYGNRAKFYIDTPRDSLFDNITEEAIKENTVKLSRSRLETKKESQVEYIRKIISWL
ncbi:polysaccharide pyruvyl transferase family protein [Halobellus sp. GM3]|uniref:polysaccharide pyruvyl transferase family protein n=1 Tax=Halobellus sp. GM3 TaxID=3458410 RepID=UPI00403D778E